MFLRRLMAVVCPALMCLICCLLFRWLDRLIGAGEFLSFVIKGLLLGVAIALILPAAGITARSSGLSGWLYGAAALMLATLVYQYLENSGAVHVPVLSQLISINGQVVFAQSAVLGFLVLTAALNGKKKR